MKKIFIVLWLIAATTFCTADTSFEDVPLEAPTKELSLEKKAMMKAAYEVGKASGLTDPEIVQAVLLQESGAGDAPSFRVANPGPNAYFGPMQIKLSSAKEVLRKWPDLFKKYNFHTRTDDEIKANLILNDRFNIEVGSKYLRHLQQTYGFTGLQLLNAYNRGPGGVMRVSDDYHYGVSARRKLAAYKSSRKHR